MKNVFFSLFLLFAAVCICRQILLLGLEVSGDRHTHAAFCRTIGWTLVKGYKPSAFREKCLTEWSLVLFNDAELSVKLYLYRVG